MVSRYQVGTAEPDEVVGSRAAQGETLMEAFADARARSRSDHVGEAWVREVGEGGRLGPRLATFRRGQAVGVDPRDPDPTREGIFRDHNCWKCGDGERPCPAGNPGACEFPHARND